MANAKSKITLSRSQDVPFNKLVLSQANVRRVKAGQSIEDLAEDIAPRTLLQSLSVRPVLDASCKVTGKFEVPAGGRRFRALELLVKQKRLAKTAPVPCVVRMRAKGLFWLATRPAWVGELSQAGALVRHQAVGYWWAAVPKERWPDDEDIVARVKQRWHKLWGDRRQELVFIGTREMDREAIVAELDACLMRLDRNGKIDTEAWLQLPDPFPMWRAAA